MVITTMSATSAPPVSGRGSILQLGAASVPRKGKRFDPHADQQDIRGQADAQQDKPRNGPQTGPRRRRRIKDLGPLARLLPDLAVQVEQAINFDRRAPP